MARFFLSAIIGNSAVLPKMCGVRSAWVLQLYILNGEKPGGARNAHYPHRFDVTKKLVDGKNQPKVFFEPIEKSIGAARSSPPVDLEDLKLLHWLSDWE